MTALLRELAAIPARVQRGVKLLDAKRPGWRKEIQRRALNMQDCKLCVLGQIFGSFGAGIGIDGLSLQVNESSELGFDSKRGLGTKIDDCFDALTTEWRRVLAEKTK